jgi:hypothetical protein
MMNLINNRSIQLMMGAIALSTVAITATPNATLAVTITYEDPGIYSASNAIGPTQQIDFETASIGITNNYNVSFDDATSGDNYTATYDKLKVDNYGVGTQTAGAGYTGKFATQIGDVLTTNLTFATTIGNNAAGIKYFGMFYSSLDGGNQLTFYDGSNILAQFTLSNIPLLLNNNSAFIGGPYDQYGAFFNFYADAGEQFTRIELNQIGGGGLESDNHTVRVPDALVRTGTGVNPGGLTYTRLPEPLDVAGTLFGGVAAFWLKRRLSAKNKR